MGGGYYLLTVQVNDGLAEHSDETTVKIGFVVGQVTVLLSTLQTKEWDLPKRQHFETTMEDILGVDGENITVITERIVSHDVDSSTVGDLGQSEISFYAKTGASIVSIGEIISALNNASPADLSQFGIISIVTSSEGTLEDSNMVVAYISTMGIALLVIITQLIAICCIKTSSARKLDVLTAALAAQKQNYDGKRNESLPNTNQFNSENPLYIECQKSELKIGFEANDVHEEDIDNNAVEVNHVSSSDQDEDLDHGRVDIDFVTNTDETGTKSATLNNTDPNKGYTGKGMSF